jgi:hypothetical protein
MRAPCVPWTRKDEIEACTLRWLGYGAAVAAVRQGRTPQAVRSRLSKLGMCHPHRKRNGLAAEVRKLWSRGLNDTGIAERLGVVVSTVQHTRKRLGLKARITHSEAGRRGVVVTNARRWGTPALLPPECWGCDRLCPARNHVEVVGWHSRVCPVNSALTEVLCRRCFKEHGWTVYREEQEATA